MDKLIAAFSAQLREAVEIGKASQLNKPTQEINKIFISGLGGSGIGGNLASELVAQEIKLPIIVNKKYDIPAFIDKNTLVIISSYSGNTEETVEAMQKAHAVGSKIIGITSGGKISAYCKENGLDCIHVPPNMPSPRACLGYSFVQQLFIMHKMGYISDKFIGEVESAADLLDKEEENIKEDAKVAAHNLHDKIPIVYSADTMEAVAVRWRQQINENGKMLCWHHVVPEMNHNELVGWRTKNDQFAVIWLRNESDYSRTQVRMKLNDEIMSKYTENRYEFWSKGNSAIETSMYLIHLGDWISWYLSVERNVDSMEVDVIDYLKGELAKVK